jgi:hypothetical protein
MSDEITQVVTLCPACERWTDQAGNGHMQGCKLASGGTKTYLPGPISTFRVERFIAIVRRTAAMGSCSQTHHEHLARDARDLLEGK